MRLAFKTFLSRILVKARKRYRFTGIVFGGVGIGVIWPAVKEDLSADRAQMEFPGIGS